MPMRWPRQIWRARVGLFIRLRLYMRIHLPKTEDANSRRLLRVVASKLNSVDPSCISTFLPPATLRIASTFTTATIFFASFRSDASMRAPHAFPVNDEIQLY